MDNWEVTWQKWLQYDRLDTQLKKELHELKHNKNALKDAFAATLTVGANGVSGVAGPGTNRINIYTVRKMVRVISEFLKENQVNYKDRGVIIGYDSKKLSKELADECVRTLGCQGIKVYLFAQVEPIPLLSYAVRYLSAALGLFFTNDEIKIYNEDGSLITYDEALEINRYLDIPENSFDIPVTGMESLETSNLLEWINGEIENAYMDHLVNRSEMRRHHMEKDKDLKIVHTPLQGASKRLITTGLQLHDFEHIYSMTDQGKNSVHLEQAIEYGEKMQADIVLMLPSQANYLQVAARNEVGQWKQLTSDELGSLLLDYILSNMDVQVLGNVRIINTSTATPLINSVCNYYNVNRIITDAGFDEIGKKINDFDRTGLTFVFGYNDDGQYLFDGFVRVSDAIHSAIIVCEMAQDWKLQGKSLFRKLDQLYSHYG